MVTMNRDSKSFLILRLHKNSPYNDMNGKKKGLYLLAGAALLIFGFYLLSKMVWIGLVPIGIGALIVGYNMYK